MTPEEADASDHLTEADREAFSGSYEAIRKLSRLAGNDKQLHSKIGATYPKHLLPRCLEQLHTM